MPILELVADLGTGMFYTLDGEESVIGRLSDCEIVLPGTQVSRRHVRLFREHDGYHVEDLGSRNGTLLNGAALRKPSPLKNGDEIQVAESKFVFRDDHDRPVSMLDDRATPAGEGSSGVAGTIVFDPNTTVWPAENPEGQLKAVFDLSKRLARSLSEDQIRVTILNTVFEVFRDIRRGYVLVPGGEGELRMVTRKVSDGADSGGGPLTQLCRRATDDREAILFVDELPAEVFATANAPVVNLDENAATIDADNDRLSVMCAPLMGTDVNTLGVVQVDREGGGRPFDMQDLELLSAMCAMAGRAIENSRLHAQHLAAQLQERELQVAARVQRLLVPSDPPVIEGFDVTHVYEPMRHVGGDYCDFVPIGDGRLAVAIGDVSGKDVSAALLMSRLSAAVQLCVDLDEDLADVVRRLNTVAVLPNMTMRFVTFMLVVLEPGRDAVDLVCAGHLPPLVHRADGSLEYLEHAATGPPLGVAPDATYGVVTVPLAPGDGMLLYTDGVTESHGSDGELFGFERIGSAVTAARAAGEHLPRAVVEAARSFGGAEGVGDDVCAIDVRRT